MKNEFPCVISHAHFHTVRDSSENTHFSCEFSVRKCYDIYRGCFKLILIYNLTFFEIKYQNIVHFEYFSADIFRLCMQINIILSSVQFGLVEYSDIIVEVN